MDRVWSIAGDRGDRGRHVNPVVLLSVTAKFFGVSDENKFVGLLLSNAQNYDLQLLGADFCQWRDLEVLVLEGHVANVPCSHRCRRTSANASWILILLFVLESIS